MTPTSTVAEAPVNVSTARDAERYRLLVESITDYAIYMLDPKGYVSSWNPGARRFKGYTPEEIIGKHFSRFYTEEDQKDGLPERALRIAQEQQRYEGQGWRVRKDGSRFWVNVVIDPIFDPDGNLLGFAKITRDLTERKYAEDALRKSEEQFRLLVQGVSDYAIYMLDTNGIVTNWNAGAQRIKGYAPAEIIGQHFSKFYSAEDRDRGEPQKGLATALRDGRFEKEGWRYKKDGGRFWANVVIDPIRNDAGELIGFAKITRDMTERRETQATLDRAREAIAQSQKMEAIGQLTGGVAHDFNNLLMAVMGSLELLRRRIPDDPKLKLLINNAFDGARRGVALTQRMLSFARRQELALTSVHLRPLVDGMRDLLERTLGPQIKILTDIPADLPAVGADVNQLETGLLNLAVNARDAMAEGGTIYISARVVAVESDLAPKTLRDSCVVLSVRDTGSGMDARTLARALEPFFTTKGVGKGTGLGLSMVHGMAEQIGGQLRLESHVGQGTTAEIWLPMALEGMATLSAGPPAAEAARSAAMNIVVVDDDPLVLVNTKAMLEEFGHTVFEASDGARALDILRTTPDIHLVITDQAMPQMTGTQLAAVIRVEWPHIKMLLVSGFAELPEDAPQDIQKLAKPFSLDDLENAIGSVKTGIGTTAKFESSYRQ